MREVDKNNIPTSQGKFCAGVEIWKSLMRKKYSVPEEYEILMCYGQNNEIEPWMAFCERQNAAPAVSKTHRGLFWFYEDGHQEYCPSEYEYFYSTQSQYKSSDDGSEMSQIDSDCLAHFLQIVGVIQCSGWHQHNLMLQINMNHDGKIRADMPSLEQTVFALLYMRQLIGNKGNDDLLNTACGIYIRHSSCTAKTTYIEGECQAWNRFLQDAPLNDAVAKIVRSRELLLEIFQYGALIIHSPDRVKNSQVRELFGKLYADKTLRVNALFSLNQVMRQLFADAGNIAVLIQNDFAHWIDDKKVPAPNVMWQQNMFQWNPIIAKAEGSPDEESQFDSAYNIEISEVRQ